MADPFFTSDTHYWHGNVIRYCNRPFAEEGGVLIRPSECRFQSPDTCVVDVEAMNRLMIERWNERVGPRDTVYHIGDFAMGPRIYLAPTRKRLHGRIVLVRGNHDRSQTAMLESGFEEVVDELLLDVPGYGNVYLHHQPLYDPSLWHGA